VVVGRPGESDRRGAGDGGGEEPGEEDAEQHLSHHDHHLEAWDGILAKL
jgi:hypothetical protein